MSTFRYVWMVGLVVTFLIVAVPIFLFVQPDSVRSEPASLTDPWAGVPQHVDPTSHADLLEGPFASGADVTQACLTCHETASHEVMQTSHWT